MTSPGSAPLEADEQGVLDAGAALKQYVRQHQQSLIPEAERLQWIQAAGRTRTSRTTTSRTRTSRTSTSRTSTSLDPVHQVSVPLEPVRYL